jgi:hypothetical protein
MTFVLGNLHCSLLKIPDLKVFDVADLNASKGELGNTAQNYWGGQGQSTSQVSQLFKEGFIVINTDSEDERAFQEAKRTHGSVFQWHGSALENYYSILRNGLMNLSNTHLMTAGAAYG